MEITYNTTKICDATVFFMKIVEGGRLYLFKLVLGETYNTLGINVNTDTLVRLIMEFDKGIFSLGNPCYIVRMHLEDCVYMKNKKIVVFTLDTGLQVCITLDEM